MITITKKVNIFCSYMELCTMNIRQFLLRKIINSYEKRLVTEGFVYRVKSILDKNIKSIIRDDDFDCNIFYRLNVEMEVINLSIGDLIKDCSIIEIQRDIIFARKDDYCDIILVSSFLPNGFYEKMKGKVSKIDIEIIGISGSEYDKKYSVVAKLFDISFSNLISKKLFFGNYLPSRKKHPIDIKISSTKYPKKITNLYQKVLKNRDIKYVGLWELLNDLYFFYNDTLTNSTYKNISKSFPKPIRDFVNIKKIKHSNKTELSFIYFLENIDDFKKIPEENFPSVQLIISPFNLSKNINDKLNSQFFIDFYIPHVYDIFNDDFFIILSRNYMKYNNNNLNLKNFKFHFHKLKCNRLIQNDLLNKISEDRKKKVVGDYMNYYFK